MNRPGSTYPPLPPSPPDPPFPRHTPWLPEPRPMAPGPVWASASMVVGGSLSSFSRASAVSFTAS